MKKYRVKCRPGTRLMMGGLLLIAAALLLTGYNLWDNHRAGISAARIAAQLPGKTVTVRETAPGEEEIPDYLLNPEMEMPALEVEGNGYIGRLEIPALGLSLPVMEDWSYPKLRIAPCRYQGSVYTGDLIIAAHNYATHFGRLGSLVPGDMVTFTDTDGNTFVYQVAETQILQPTAISEMKAGEWELTLFTCTLGGKTRLTVRCVNCDSGGAL